MRGVCCNQNFITWEKLLDFDRINDFKKIYVLKVINSEGSFRKAARLIGITPSAVSQSISSLEKHLGKSLIIREKNKVSLTTEAHSLLQTANPAFEAVGSILGEKKRVLEIGRLDLGAYDSLAVDALPGFLAELREDHPKFKLNLIITRSDKLLQEKPRWCS